MPYLGKFFVPSRTGYCAAKWALHGFYGTLRIELRDSPIAISLICPGPVQTAINQTRLGGDPAGFSLNQAMRVEKAADRIIESVRAGKREDLFDSGPIGEWVAFLCPPLMDWICLKKVQSSFSTPLQTKQD